MENSPRFGMCEFSNNIMVGLHLMPLHRLNYEMFQAPKQFGRGLYPVKDYIDDERAQGRHHPLWSKEERRKYRDRKIQWQDRIMGNIEKYGLEPPKKWDMAKIFYD